ncbi:ATP/GTP-binding protein [Trebonia kvetii]|uniref:ATP/GTP-binding protein n=2 Tax=Trebonia kvetii TaxID=2480626 RepID=A0A6P2BMK5_9ACTN|nr:ATP/GTP-binding protein [Trebonia kvetii]
MAAKVKEQNLAVFGESGSGKTVLLSSFYGASQEPSFLAESLYKVLADDTGQGTRLRQNYLRMRNQAKAPEANRFAATPYSFTLKVKEPGGGKAAKAKPFNALRLIWHDYPGEWFTEEPSSTEEATRRVATFTRLLKSDVALVLVDGQKLLDYAGEEEKYLKSLLWGLRGGLEKLRDDILTDGEPLREFPRIWILALSKADLHPGLNAKGFQDLIVEKAAGDVSALHDALKTFVQVPEALSLGEDFMLLSSARFEPGKIEVTERVGLDLILPVATMLPFERLAQWAGRFAIPLKVLGGLVDHADALAGLLTGAGADAAAKFLAKIPKVVPVLAPIAIPGLAEAVKLGKSKLEEVHAQALADRDFLTAVVTQFRLDLDQGVEDHLFVKSLW